MFTEYLMTGSRMQKIVKENHNANVKKEQNEAKKKKAVTEALARLRIAERRATAKKKLPKKIKSNPKL